MCWKRYAVRHPVKVRADKVTNPDAIIIDTFQVVRQDVSGFSPVLTVNMRAASKSEPQTVVNASYSVTGFNL